MNAISGFDFVFESNEQKWATNDNLPPTAELWNSLVFTNPMKASIGVGVTTIEKPGWKISVFLPNPDSFLLRNPGFIFSLIVRTTLLILLCYLFVMWQLRPIQWLKKAAMAIARDFSHKVPSSSSSEFADLALAFNEMTEKISTYIKARDQLMANISHELRSPLTRIKLAVELSENNDQKKRLQEDIGEMEKMIEEILDSYRLDSEHGSLRLEPLDLSPLIRETLERYQGRTPGVAIPSLEQSLIVLAEPKQVKRVLVNILENALKYSPADRPAVEVRAYRTSKDVFIEVIDQGIGIPEDQLEKVFEPFYRVDSSRSRNTGGSRIGA